VTDDVVCQPNISVGQLLIGYGILAYFAIGLVVLGMFLTLSIFVTKPTPRWTWIVVSSLPVVAIWPGLLGRAFRAAWKVKT
jgi:uncharacterized membrane protein